jgi:hypothetical protein
MKVLKKIQPYAHVIIGLLAVAWFFGGCSLIEKPLRNLDKNYANYEAKVSQYKRKIDALNKIIVYKTRTGSRYHRGYHYHSRNYSIPLGDAITTGYTPCGVCRPTNPGMDILNPPFYKEPWWIALIKFIIWGTGLYFCCWFYITVTSNSKS